MSSAIKLQGVSFSIFGAVRVSDPASNIINRRIRAIAGLCKPEQSGASEAPSTHHQAQILNLWIIFRLSFAYMS
jgi:hypothetical protein